MSHVSVLLHDTIDALGVRPDGVYVDGTYGRGGHTRALLDLLGPEGRLLCIDRDPTAIAHAQETWGSDPRVIIRHGTFSQLESIVTSLGWLGRVDGVFLDLGISSPQIDNNDRGFSFMRDGPLDMRMDTSQGQTAAEWVNTAPFEQLAYVFAVYGEERWAKQIARAIERTREQSPINTTLALAELIRHSVPRPTTNKHPATRCFQAIRIFINQELQEVEAVLPQIVHALSVGGKLAIISFHSLEDRIVKRFIKDNSTISIPRGIPLLESELPLPLLKALSKGIQPGDAEVSSNPRSRSAVLRVAMKQKDA